MRFLPAAALLVLAACAPQDDMPEPRDGRALYTATCAACHGVDATGGGPLAATLELSPPDLTRIAARNGGAFPRAQVLSQIDGYTRRDQADGMPEFGALLQGDLIPYDSGDGRMTPTPRRLIALLEYLESVQAP